MSTSKPKPTSVPDHVDARDEARRIWLVTKMGVLGMYRSQLPRMAAALAYRTIFSIIPVMAIGLLIFGSVVSDAQVESGVRRVLTFAGISQISAIEQGSVEASDPDDHTAQMEQADRAQHDLQALDAQDPEHPEHIESNPFASGDLEEVITNLITRVNNSIRNVPTGWIALTSGLVLLYAAMSMLIEIEKSFNQLCGAPSGRSWLRRLMLYWTILTAGSLMLAATFLAGDAFTRWVVSVAGDDSIIGAVMAGYGVSVLISTVLLLGAYLIIPNSKIQFRSALAGAFFAAVLWELGKLGFTTYLRYTTGYAKFYGSIAILPLFMLWVYLTWLIVLFGMQASHALQNFSQLVESKMRSLTDPGGRSVGLIDPLIFIAIAREIEAGFELGEPRTAQEIATRVKLEPTQVVDMLGALTDAGITNRVYQGDAFVGWTPARPGERTGLDAVLEAAHRVDGFRRTGVDEQVPEGIRLATVQACKGLTLGSLNGSDEPSGVDQGTDQSTDQSTDKER